MASKTLFNSRASRPADATNQAGGRAYALSPEHTLAQYAATGTFNTTFYATDAEQLERVLDLATRVDVEMVAKTAVFARQRGFMKDMPALLVAVLANRDSKLLARVFPRVVDNGKMLRNFVQIVRSGVSGRKSLGSAPKRAVRAWFDTRTPEAIFRQSTGASPSMNDVIKLARPSPKNHLGQVDVMRQSLYGYLIGKKDVAVDTLPASVRAFESFKTTGGDVPDVPYEMLTALSLDTEQWTQIAKRMSFTQLRMNVNTLLRHGVFQDPAMVAFVADKLRDPVLVRNSRVFPFQLLAAYRAATADVPRAITGALQDALEIAIENVPRIAGKVYLCPDVSGSMQTAVTGVRKGATSSVRCVDVAALVTAAFLRRNEDADVLPFSDDVVPMKTRLNPRDSVMTNAHVLSSLPSGGTACSAPLRHLNAQNAKGDLVIFVSDNMSWVDFAGNSRGTAMADEWLRFKVRNPNAKLVLVDIQPYGTTQMHDRPDVLNVGGFSDSVFDVISLFAKGELSAAHWLDEIRRVAL